MIEIEVLDGRVRASDDGRPITLTLDDAWLVVALTLAGEPGLHARTVMSALGVSSATLRKRMERFRARTGLEFTSEGVKADKVYRLDRAGVDVDALRFLEMTDEIRRSGDQGVDDAVEAARSLWKSGLPQFPGRPGPAPDAYDRLGKAYGYLADRCRRILIVDDQVGDNLAQRLGRSRCTVAHTFDEFEKLRADLGNFDLAVVDLHLTNTYADATGDTIVREINAMGVALPVAMITRRPPENRSVPEWIKSLALVDVIFKAGDGPGADMAYVAQRVNELLREGTTALACDQLMQRVQRLRRKARQRLRADRSEADYREAVDQMERDADRIGRLASETRLGPARAETERFVTTYGE
ncbi:hypothetical protein [Micromonospora sp. NPDC005203]|uniref:hypothetical protein n=1 Tax=Micromonospora sp. NPDC005203 TaxID=3364226 RepID=UPI00368C81B2